MYFARDDGSQIMIPYQQTLDTLEFKKGKGIDHAISWQSNEVHTLKTYITFLHSTKLSGYGIGIKLGQNLLVVGENK